MLKWAESADYFIGAENRVKISHHFTDRLTHRWRASEAAIMVGTHTAMKDNPRLDTRFWPAKNPIRVLLDRKASLPDHFALMNQQAPTLIFTEEESRVSKNLEWVKVNFDEQLIPRILNILHQKGISSLIVEGGAKLLQSFIDAGIWDEARVISNPLLRINEGIAAPVLKDAICAGKQLLPQDQITYYKPKKNPISVEN
jgi:diaminohydroxyphosphoribosylaminopyrimidine deaminase/5-amino-6-(5-phosphoribosylamino)uracil reductase